MVDRKSSSSRTLDPLSFQSFLQFTLGKTTAFKITVEYLSAESLISDEDVFLLGLLGRNRLQTRQKHVFIITHQALQSGEVSIPAPKPKIR